MPRVAWSKEKKIVRTAVLFIDSPANNELSPSQCPVGEGLGSIKPQTKPKMSQAKISVEC